MGTAAEMMLMPYGSLIVGFSSGIISTLGFVYLKVRTPGEGLGAGECWVSVFLGVPREGDGAGKSWVCVFGASRILASWGRCHRPWAEQHPTPLSSHSWSPSCGSRTHAAFTTCMAFPAS